MMIGDYNNKERCDYMFLKKGQFIIMDFMVMTEMANLSLVIMEGSDIIIISYYQSKHTKSDQLQPLSSIQTNHSIMYTPIQHQPQYMSKRFSFHKQIAQEQRDAIKAKRRKQLLEQQMNQQFPLNSEVFRKYHEIPNRNLYLYRQEMFDTLDETDIENLSEDQMYDLCTDLLYLVTNDDEFMVPYSIRFRKDKSQLTATLVAYVFDMIDIEEVKQWLPYMNEESHSVVYFKILCFQDEENDMQPYINDNDFLHSIIMDWNLVQQSCEVINRLLFDIRISDEFVKQVLQKLIQMNYQRCLPYNATLIDITLRLMQLLDIHISKKQYHYLRLLLNQILIQSEKRNILPSSMTIYLLDRAFETAKSNCIILLSEEGFNAMMGLLTREYRKDFVQQRDNVLVMKQNGIQLKKQWIGRFLEIAINYLRANDLFDQKVCIDDALLRDMQPPKFWHDSYQKYAKLQNFNQQIKKKHGLLSQNQIVKYQKFETEQKIQSQVSLQI